MPLITIDAEQCREDGICALVCRKVFSQEVSGSGPRVAHPEFCHSCGQCVLMCPTGAIRHADFGADRFHPVEKALFPTYEQVREMIVSRRSTRAFLDRPVARELVERVIDGARFAPSAKNSQSTEYIVVEDKSLLHGVASATAEWLGKVGERLKNPVWRSLYLLGGTRDREEVMRWIGQFGFMAEKMREHEDFVLFDAPILLLFHADRRTRFAEANANLALQNATFVASSLGLGSFYTGYVVTAWSHEKKLRKLLQVPEKHKVYAGLAIGYPEIRFTKWIERKPPKTKWM